MAVQSSAAVAHIPPESNLDARLKPLHDEAISLWRNTPASLPLFRPAQSGFARWRHARATARLIDEVANRVETYPLDPGSRDAWKRTLSEHLQLAGEAHFGWPAGYRRLLFGDAFHQSAVDFARRARAFDPALELDDLWQALRNVWIGNSLQMLLGRPVTLAPALFAYSMLYPVTDNYLDGRKIDPAAKRQFAERLGRRLHGEHILPVHPVETRAFDLIARIEEAFQRRSFVDVWISLRAIHRAQLDSLRQQQGRSLSEQELIEVSVAKGGTSVLADLYLVGGGASRAEEHLAFCYGVFLQLLDDLQDVKVDMGAGHQTLFTSAAREGPLDDVTARLTRFIDAALDSTPVLGAREHADCLDLIRRNCRALLVGVVAEHPELFTRGFRRELERQWPLSLSAMRRLRRRALHRFRTTSERVHERFGVTPLELLLGTRT